MRVEIRTARPDDIRGLGALEKVCYPQLSEVVSWKPELLAEHQRVFGDGQLVADADGTLIGHSANFITRSERVFRPHTFRDITHRGTFAGHDPDGDVLYGAEIMVHPDQRRRGIGRRFYEARFALTRRLGLRYFAAGGRLPGYGRVAARMSAEQYVRGVLEERWSDRVLTAQQRSGLQVVGVLRDYMMDPSSRNWAALLVWENPDLARPGPGLPWIASPAAGGLTQPT